MARKKLGELLVERGIIDEQQLNAALGYQRQWGHRLGTALVAKGFISEGLLTKVLSESLDIPMLDLSTVTIDKDAMQMVHANLCETHDLIPVTLSVEKGRKILTVAMADPLNLSAVEEIEFTSGCAVRPVLAQISSIGQAVRRFYRGEQIQISPLRFQLEQPASAEDMAILRGSVHEQAAALAAALPTPGVDDPVVELHDEVTDRTALAEIEAARRLGRSGVAQVAQISQIDIERIDALESRFWALMRALARKGYITKEEFLRELGPAE